MRCQARGQRTGSGLEFEVVWRKRMDTALSCLFNTAARCLVSNTVDEKTKSTKPHPMQRYKTSLRKATSSKCT